MLFVSASFIPSNKRLTVTILDNQFYMNGELTYKGRYWENSKIEGLLFNSRMVQGIFDDANPATRSNFKYPDTGLWDANRNTNEFVESMKKWRSHGLLAFTLNLQGGSPLGYGNNGWINTAFDEKGNLKHPYINRLEKILNKAEELKMVVILGYFYFGQDQILKNEQSVINAVDNITHWILDKGYRNILIEINNECDIQYDHKILQPERVHELIQRVQQMKKGGYRLLVSTSYTGGKIPLPNVTKAADYILLHGNGVNSSVQLRKMIDETKILIKDNIKPIVFNEDDHFNFESDTSNFIESVRSYVSWGYFDYRMKDEGFENGFQSVPVDWGINSDRKKKFFQKLKEITGY
jgi:hypothetical protein